MRTIALLSPDTPDVTHRLHRAFPGAEVFDISIQQIEGVVARHRPSALVVDSRGLARGCAPVLDVVQGRFPQLASVALFRDPSDLLNFALDICQARFNGILVGGLDDPDRIRETFANAAMSSVARTVEHVCQPGAPTLAASNLMRPLGKLKTIEHAATFSRELGQPLATLRRELQIAGLFPCRSLLACVRVLSAARQLGDDAMSTDRIAANVGYGSAIALHNACHRWLNTTTHRLRVGGGLWLASDLFAKEVASYRRRAAG